MLNPRGTKNELLQRIYQEREFIVTQLSLDADELLNLDNDPYGGVQGDGNDDPIVCEVCKEGPLPSSAIVKCDGEHEFETGYHISCLPKVQNDAEEWVLPTVSDTHEWLCPVCVINGVLIIEAVKDKRIKRGKTEYLVSYTSSADAWQSWSHLSNCGPIIKRLVRDYNLAHRKD